MLCFSTIFNLKSRKFLGKIRTVFGEINPQLHRFDYLLNHWGSKYKNLEATQLFIDFTKAFDSIHRGKMKQILLAYGVPKETATVIMMLYKNTKAIVCSLNGDTDFFNIVTGVLQGDT